jgi:hypothetical protein
VSHAEQQRVAGLLTDALLAVDKRSQQREDDNTEPIFLVLRSAASIKSTIKKTGFFFQNLWHL